MGGCGGISKELLGPVEGVFGVLTSALVRLLPVLGSVAKFVGGPKACVVQGTCDCFIRTVDSPGVVHRFRCGGSGSRSVWV
jgi:hypothetical protein